MTLIAVSLAVVIGLLLSLTYAVVQLLNGNERIERALRDALGSPDAAYADQPEEIRRADR